MSDGDETEDEMRAWVSRACAVLAEYHAVTVTAAAAPVTRNQLSGNCSEATTAPGPLTVQYEKLYPGGGSASTE